MTTLKLKTLVGLFALSATLATTAAEATTLKLSHVRPQGTAIDKDAQAFADDVAAASDGDLTVKLYPANALGDYTVVQERVSLGAVDMAVQPPASGSDKRFQLPYLPYLVETWDEAREVFAPGAPMREAIKGLYADQNIHLLGVWPAYFGGIALHTEVKDPADPTVDKGAKLRVPPTKAFKLLADDIGYIGSPLPFSDAFTALQTGVVDGVMGSGAEGYYASFRELTDYYVPLNTHFEMWYLVINQDVYDELDANEQKALDAAAARFEAKRWDNAEADQTRNEKLLEAAGTTIVPVSAEQIAATAEIAREQVWPTIIDDIGADWAQPILDAAIH